MKKCPSCKLENLTFIDSSAKIQCDYPEYSAEWEEYECQDCGASLMVEDGYISVRRFNFTKFEYVTMMRYSVNWEKKIEESYNEQ